ncbi:hypothetical protein HNR23_005172 [Nocardiopsis mwathae]|uniref:Lipoprotein n=1 Tax=Nocardiopsis mwathae TaxID=1472723 RepID=A0A7X0D7Y3_9ACTN|nr:hypothetical protein [Nocardiopsis mwathae]MBB6175112.1 hypothetical protein [Nocardiopsis mwathae]
MLKKIAAAAAGAGLMVAVAGCSALPLPGLGGPSPLEIVRNMASNAEQADTYSATISMTGALGGESMEMSGDVDYVREPEPTMRMEMGVDGQQVTVLMRGSEMLTKTDIPGVGDMGGDMPEWIRMEMGQAGVEVANQDPLSEVQRLIAAKEAEEAGSEDVNGVATTKYVGSYSTEEALREVDDPEARQAARETFEKAGVDTVDFEVYVDGDEQPRRVISKLGDAFTSTVDFRSFNEPMEIDYPAEDRIGDFPMPGGDLGDLGDLGEMGDMGDLGVY